MLELSHPELLLKRDKVMITNAIGSTIQMGVQLKGLKGVMIVFHSPKSEFLEGEERSQLMKIVSACKLAEDDVMLINTAFAKNVSFSWLKNNLGAKAILVFGEIPLSNNLNLRKYEAYTIDGVRMVKSEGLTKLLGSQPDKKALWDQLRKIFGI